MRLPATDLLEPSRLRAALGRRAVDRWDGVVLVVARAGVRVESRAVVAAKLRRVGQSALGFLVEREQVPSGSVLVLDRVDAGGARAVVVDLGEAR